eukprot:TRINITY_DN1157_c0_g7_i1.p1 TRINITY_DN1157_c0_g7~~TRINITY_DN1157_c0_g7_i1.p1  ORF type:complete len:233 (-),score=17.08 TRINITY_DN1157_c0_g7_i1:194-892(-)
MLGKRSRPTIRKLPEPLIPGDPTGFSDGVTSPKSPLELKILSPRRLNDRDSGGIGLGIVAALEKSGEISAKLILGSLNLNRSDPIPVVSAKLRGCFGEECESGFSESYTCVISHGPNKSPFTRIYNNNGDEDGNGFDRRQLKDLGVFYASPPSFFEETLPAFPDSDFLSSCYLCRKKLHGKDIYMYRGEKAFCSTECRYRQIVSDERGEKCRSEASGRSDISSSPYSTSIVA